MSNNYQKFIRRQYHRKAARFQAWLCAIITPLLLGLCLTGAPAGLILFVSLALAACVLLGIRHGLGTL